MPKILGIDLGTTNSAVAVIEGGEPRILENAEGNRTTPSIAAISKSGERLVGLLAKRQSVTNPKNTIFSVKRLMGRKFTDPEVQRDKAWLSYDIQAGPTGGVEVKMGDKWYSPEEISAAILGKLKADAEAKLGEKVTEAVITVPAYFDDSQRQATKNAGEIAGLKVSRLVNEPTAAALAYGLNKKKNEKIVVYDFGGGTFDISVLEVGDDTVEVKSTGGDTHLGGDDFDKKIQEYLVAEYKKQEGIDISKDALALQRLKEAAEKAKHELSTATETEINLPYISSGPDGPKHFLMKLSRAKLESLVQDYIDHSVQLTKETVTSAAPKGAGYQLSEINEVILVGGQTRMPAIQEAVKKLFGKDAHQGINPDEVVAIGAAVQAGILQGDVKDILLLDVTPLGLSIETYGGVATPMIQKNTTVPTAKTQVFSTAADNQTSVEVHVLQGERPMANDNKTLAKFILDGIPPSPRGIPQVEVTFDIDANGILNVSAKDKASGKTQSVKIEASTNLSKDEIEKLKKEAAEHAVEDAKKKELIDVRNQAESTIYLAEKSMNDAGDKLPADVKTGITEKLEALKKVKDGEDKAAIESALAALSTEIQKIGQAAYNKPNNGPEKRDGGDPAANPNQNLINPVKVPKEGLRPGLWKSVIVDVLSIATAALFGYFYYRYLASGLSPWYVFGGLLLFCTASVMQIFLAKDLKRRSLVMVGETIAWIIFFYHYDNWEILGITGVVILVLLLWGYLESRAAERNSIEIHFFQVSRGVIAKATTAALLFMLLVYAPQINSSNAFVPRQSFRTFFDWSSGFFNNLYPGVPFNDSFGSFTQGLAKMELQNNPTYQSSSPQAQSEEVQQASTQIANNFANNSSTPPNSSEQTSDVMYNYIVGTLANWQSQFQDGFIIGWIIVLFIILRTVGLVFVWIAQFIAVIFYEIFLSSGFMHIEETSQTKEIIRY